MEHKSKIRCLHRRFLCLDPSRWSLAIGLACLTLGGCNQSADSPLVPQATRRDVAEPVQVPVRKAWIEADAVLIIERRTRASVEQHITLPNATAMRGENFIAIVALRQEGLSSGRLAAGDALAQFRADLYPFAAVAGGDLISGTDALGAYSWAEKEVAPGLTCAMAIRTLRFPARPMPPGIASMTVVMRNCVPGTAADAMAPFAAERLAQSGPVRSSAGETGVHLLSPLAGPLPSPSSGL